MPATTLAAPPNTGSPLLISATHVRAWWSISAAPSGGPSVTGSSTARRTQRAASSPARLPSPCLTKWLAVGPSNQPITSTLRPSSQASSGGTRTPDWSARPAARSAPYSAASGAGSEAYALTANRRLPTRASNVARSPGV